MGLTIINTRAVLEALFGVADQLSCAPRNTPSATGPMNLEVKKYRRRSGWLPVRGDRCAATYFVAMIVFAIETYNFFAIPFLVLFVFGYYWAGFGTLYQEHQGRLRWLKQQRLETGASAGVRRRPRASSDRAATSSYD